MRWCRELGRRAGRRWEWEAPTESRAGFSWLRSGGGGLGDSRAGWGQDDGIAGASAGKREVSGKRLGLPKRQSSEPAGGSLLTPEQLEGLTLAPQARVASKRRPICLASSRHCECRSGTTSRWYCERPDS